MGTDPRLSGRDCRESGLDCLYSYAADFGIDTETITYTLPGLPSPNEAIDAGGRYAAEGAERNLQLRQQDYDAMTPREKAGKNRPAKAWEFCGRVCRTREVPEDKKCYYFAAAGTNMSSAWCNVKLNNAAACNQGDSEVGAYHNHPGTTPLSGTDRTRGRLIGATFRDQEGDLITDVFNPKTGRYERFVNGRSIGGGLHPNAGKVPR